MTQGPLGSMSERHINKWFQTESTLQDFHFTEATSRTVRIPNTIDFAAHTHGDKASTILMGKVPVPYAFQGRVPTADKVETF